jgi:hypothetical protein
MNIGIFSTHNLWPTHFETELELLQKNLDIKNNVFFYHCDKSITNCELIWHFALQQNVTINRQRKGTCFYCQEKQKRGLLLIDGTFLLQSLISNKQKKIQYTIEPEALVNETTIKKLVIDNSYKIGWSMMSTLISLLRNPFITPANYKRELSDLYQDCCRIYYSTKQYIQENGLEKIYLYNGRLSYTNAIMSAAKSLNTDFYVHDRGSDLTKYLLFNRHPMHSIEKVTERILETWDSERDEEKKKRLGSQFFHDRENNIIGSWYSFLDKQDKNLLPANWNDKIQNIGFFTSSEDELASISDEWNLTLFKSQLEGIKFVSDIISNLPDTHLYIRVHPNVESMSDDYKSLLVKLSYNNNTTLINYDSPVSSYALLKKCNKIITFGSTVGIEAVFWGKPSILLGKSFYYMLKGVIIPKTQDELVNLLTRSIDDPPEAGDVLKYGYFMKTFGVEYQYYKPVDIMSGNFKGINLGEPKESYKPSLIEKITSRINNLINLY